jgi:hypothetical protein
MDGQKGNTGGPKTLICSLIFKRTYKKVNIKYYQLNVDLYNHITVPTHTQKRVIAG